MDNWLFDQSNAGLGVVQRFRARREREREGEREREREGGRERGRERERERERWGERERERANKRERKKESRIPTFDLNVCPSAPPPARV